MKTVSILFAILALCSGCSYQHTPIVEFHPAVPYQSPKHERKSEIKPDPDGTHTASLGDTLFVIKRYLLTDEEFAFQVPEDLNQFPPPPTWSQTHTWENYIVYTSPDYYEGEIGIVATRDGRLPESPQVLQVKGSKTGRNWRIDAKAGTNLFSRKAQTLEVWGVRYGGHRNGATEFQIVDQANANVSQVVQNLVVNDEDLIQGVVIKGVLVKVVGQQERGTISFTIEDVDFKSKK